jgi:hypothetical protein
MTLFKKLSLVFCAVTIAFSLSAPVYAYAAGNNQNNAPAGSQGFVPCGSYADNPCTLVDIFNLIIGITNFLIGFAGVIAVFTVVLSGYFMVVAAGNAEKITAAKKQLVGGVIGFFFVMAAMILANFLIFGARPIIPGNAMTLIRGEPTSIIRCPIGFILGKASCAPVTNSAPPANDDTTD